jgi:hypothetical protein
MNFPVLFCTRNIKKKRINNYIPFSTIKESNYMDYKDKKKNKKKYEYFIFRLDLCKDVKQYYIKLLIEFKFSSKFSPCINCGGKLRKYCPNSLIKKRCDANNNYFQTEIESFKICKFGNNLKNNEDCLYLDILMYQLAISDLSKSDSLFFEPDTDEISYDPNFNRLFDFTSLEITINESLQTNFVLVKKLIQKLNLKLPKDVFMYLFEFL